MMLTSGFKTPKELIDYCRLHCQTERSLFNGRQINDMIKLAGNPDGFVDRVDPSYWISVDKESMTELCNLADLRNKSNDNPQQPRP